MPVIAGTTKESVINKAREALIAKKIPYTIKRTKTWFFVSSPKPVTAQKALREAGLEMNPITTMHSVWCSRCGAIRTFKKRAGDWICQKCGARLLMFKNPKKAKAMVHPEALESLARYKDDLKAGHTSAAEYWRGQAGAYFTANPRKLGSRTHLESHRTEESARRALEKLKKNRPDRVHRLWYSGPYQCWMVGSYISVDNPLTKAEKREIINLANTQFAISRKYADQPVRSSFWYGRSVGMGKIAKMFNPLIDEYRRKYVGKSATLDGKPAKIYPIMGGTAAAIVSYARSGEASWFTVHEVMTKRGGKFILLRDHLAANPKERKWDPISEILQDEDEEEDDMIGIEINPLGAFICGRCGKRFHSMETLNKHLLKVHKVRNPLTAIGSAALTGVGIGAGFKAVDYAWNRLGLPRVKKNPVKPHTTAMVSKLPKCDFCAHTARYDGKTFMGPWAYMCERHFRINGVGLGLGKGQILIVKEKGR